jgi:signal transduction histidine kinase
MILPRLHWWIPLSVALLGVYALVSAMLGPGYRLALFGNTAQTVLLLLLLGVNLLNAARARGNTRYFWASLALAAAFWLAAQGLWTWYEVVARKVVPVPFIGDVLFFVHIVPIMGALAVRPHRPAAGRLLDFGNLDLTVLLLWWVYLYGFLVIPWQYVALDIPQYSFSFEVLYLVENLVLLVALTILSFRLQGYWRRVYMPLLAAAAFYAFASQIINAAITAGRYHTGSLYDLPLIVSMALFVWVGLVARQPNTDPVREMSPLMPAIALSRVAMAAVVSIPLLAGWGMLTRNVSHEVIRFRAFLTLAAMVVLPFFVFLKQYLLDRELVRMLGISRHNYENLKRLQAQLVQAEKLSAISQFVAGAAHEINNPLTAVIGYSDLLEQDCPEGDERRQWALKIGQQARRTQELVKHLLSFAKQAPGEKNPTDLNALLANAVELRELDLKGDHIRIAKRFDERIPPVPADANQLLQVWFHIIGNAIDAMSQNGGGLLTVSSRLEDDIVIIEFADSGPGVKDPQRIFDPFYTTKPIGKGAGLGLSACYGIISDHGGTITCDNRPEGGATFTLRFPTTANASA